MRTSEQRVFIVDDDEAVLDAMTMLLETVNITCHCFTSATKFLDFYNGSQRGCLVLDIRMPGMNGLELQRHLKEQGVLLPIIFVTGHGDIEMAVEAMRRGALDFLRKPFREQDLLDRIQQALDFEAGLWTRWSDQEHALKSIQSLTAREREVFDCVVSGKANKVVAADLGISERTVEVHRSQVMKKLNARNLAELVRLKIESEKPGQTF